MTFNELESLNQQLATETAIANEYAASYSAKRERFAAQGELTLVRALDDEAYKVMSAYAEKIGKLQARIGRLERESSAPELPHSPERIRFLERAITHYLRVAANDPNAINSLRDALDNEWTFKE